MVKHELWDSFVFPANQNATNSYFIPNKRKRRATELLVQELVCVYAFLGMWACMASVVFVCVCVICNNRTKAKWLQCLHIWCQRLFSSAWNMWKNSHLTLEYGSTARLNREGFLWKVCLMVKPGPNKCKKHLFLQLFNMQPVTTAMRLSITLVGIKRK